MPQHNGPVLVDTNTIIEAHRTGCWRALAGAYVLETVETCFIETQTGSHARRPAQTIDPNALRLSLRGGIHPVSTLHLAEVDLIGGVVLDAGERALWAHALHHSGNWVLCGPDAASMRFGYGQGQRDRLISLGHLLRDIGCRPNTALRANYEQAWLDDLIRKLVLGLL
jgi:hypothetical protein